MKHRVYMRDWYFNAGIIGFLTILCEGDIIDKCEYVKNGQLEIGENYIEFDDKVIDEFEEKFIKQAFLELFDIGFYIRKLKNILKEMEKEKSTLSKVLKNISGTIYKKFFIAMDMENIYTLDDINKIKELMRKYVEKLEKYTNMKIFKYLQKEGNSDFINWFLNYKFTGIVSINKLNDYIKSIKKEMKKVKTKDLCISCQKKKAEIEFNNAISNIIGFNRRNSNWIWGFKTANLKLCSSCSLVYTCAIISFKLAIESSYVL